jgi:hypothetical protein
MKSKKLSLTWSLIPKPCSICKFFKLQLAKQDHFLKKLIAPKANLEKDFSENG